jgi:flagellar export protein FliJ
MAFRYPLQSVLRLKQSLERQEEQRLFTIAARVARLRSAIEQLEDSRLEAQRVASEEMIRGSWGAVVQFAAACDAAAAEAERPLRAQLAEAERQRLEQLTVYKNARQKREIFEGLRERQEERYDREAAHREQEQVDDTFLTRFRRDSAE